MTSRFQKQFYKNKAFKNVSFGTPVFRVSGNDAVNL